jgi:hypothetical protein
MFEGTDVEEANARAAIGIREAPLYLYIRVPRSGAEIVYPNGETETVEGGAVIRINPDGTLNITPGGPPPEEPEEPGYPEEPEEPEEPAPPSPSPDGPEPMLPGSSGGGGCNGGMGMTGLLSAIGLLKKRP